MSKVLSIVKPTSPAEKTTRTTVDTIQVTEQVIASWHAPPFQRPLGVNDKVREVAEEIRETGVVPGILTIGILSQTRYLLDGQHRVHAVRLSEKEEVYADVRYFFCNSMAEMGAEFVRLNSQLRKMRPDDMLRGLEGSLAALRSIRERCRFVGYDMIRRSDSSPILSMSVALRIWRGSQTEVPASTFGMGAAALAETVTAEEADQLCGFLSTSLTAWGRDVQYSRLWSVLNLILCAWLYRRTVITQYTGKTPRLSREQFKQCLMSLSADKNYVDWLVGRHMGQRDRSPAYDRIKRIFAARLTQEMGRKPSLPAPAWATHGG